MYQTMRGSLRRHAVLMRRSDTFEEIPGNSQKRKSVKVMPTEIHASYMLKGTCSLAIVQNKMLMICVLLFLAI
jgi:hypothetical protein